MFTSNKNGARTVRPQEESAEGNAWHTSRKRFKQKQFFVETESVVFSTAAHGGSTPGQPSFHVARCNFAMRARAIHEFGVDPKISACWRPDQAVHELSRKSRTVSQDRARRHAVERQHGAARRSDHQPAVRRSTNGAKLDVRNKLGWTPLLVAEGGQFGATVKEFPEAAAMVRKMMRERGMDPELYSKAGARRAVTR
jgi:hypothetical protein